MRIGNFFAGFSAALAAISVSGAVFAQDALQGLERIGKPVPKGLNMQPASTPVAERLQWLDNMVLVIITIITLFVLGLLFWILVRYNQRANKTPATFTHNSLIEVIWTLGPILILIVIGSFSLPTLFQQMEIPEADVSIKITGNQWYWTYEYSDSEFEFDSYIIDASYEIDDEAAGWGADQPMGPAGVRSDITTKKLEYFGFSSDEFLLATDTSVVVPVNKNVVLNITGSDVIHSWAIPAFGVKLDAVPGRLAQTWFKATKEGVYFGQCSELCGKDHTYMPITVKVVSEQAYAEWLAGAVEEYAGKSSALAVASN